MYFFFYTASMDDSSLFKSTLLNFTRENIENIFTIIYLP